MVNLVETGTTKKRGRGRPKQSDLPAPRALPTSKGMGKRQQLIDKVVDRVRGVDGDRVAQIDDMGEKLVEASDQRAIWLSKHKECREALIDIMGKKRIDEYLIRVDTRTFRLVLTQETKVSAKKLKIEPTES